LVDVSNNPSGDNNTLTAGTDEPSSDTSQDDFFQEAAPWSLAPNFTGIGYTLELGYADNIHGGVCAGDAGSCFPQHVWGSGNGAATVFLGAGVGPVGNCAASQFCGPNLHTNMDGAGNVVGCYDGGALRITAPTTTTGKSITIGPSSMEGAIKISAGDWVNGGYSFKTNFTGSITITANVTITGACIGGTLASDTVTVPLGTIGYSAVNGADWLPTGDANSVLSWQGAVKAQANLCGGGKLDASKGAVFNATVTGVPAGKAITFRFKYRDPAAKGKPNTDCLDTSDPNRAKADVCGASWSATKTDP